MARLIMYESAFSAKGTKYPSSDWVLDNACMVSSYILYALSRLTLANFTYFISI